MNEYIKRLKLIDHISIELNIHKNDFVDKLKLHVDQRDIGWFSDSFDAFSSSENVYKGYVGYDGFKIKKRRRFFDINMNIAVAEGRYRQTNDKLIVDTEINGFNSILIPFFVLIPIIYLFAIIFVISIGSFKNHVFLIAIPFIIIHGIIMVGLPYLLARRSVQNLKRELEREFYFIIKNGN